MAEPDQDAGHVARLRPAVASCWDQRHQRHSGVVNHRPGRQERARPRSYPRQPVDTIGARRSSLSGRVLPAQATTPARSIDGSGSCKNSSCWRLYPVLWIIVIRCSTVCWTFYCASSVCAELHCTDHITPVLREPNLLPIRERVKFKVTCLVRQSLSGQVIAASCPTALGAFCGQLTFRLAWCREHSAVTATELLQPLDLASRTHFRSSCAIETSPTNCSDDSWSETFFGKHEHGARWPLICGVLEKHLLTYLLTYFLTTPVKMM